MRVLLVVRQYPPLIGGLETAVAQLAIGLVHRRVDVEVLTLDCRIRGRAVRLARFERIDGIPVTRVPSWSRRYALPRWRPPASGYDLIHFHGIDGFLEQWHRWGRRLPAVLSTHGLIFHTSRLARVKQWYWHELFPARARGLQVIASSAQDGARLAAVGVTAPVIPNPVEIIGGQGGRRQKRHDLVCIGRLAEHKGLENLVAAFRLLAMQRPGVRLVVAGEDWDGTGARLGRLPPGMVLLGAVDEPTKRQLWAGTRLAVFPSRAEGFGLALLEALGAGCVVAAQPNPAHRELIVDGHNGYLLDFSQAAEAAKALGRLLDASACHSAVSVAARRTAEDYRPERVIPKVQAVYRTAMRRAPGCWESEPGGD
ncbi:MAG: glycosyltransferase family 4 protein [Thermaerobacter sp.]|nr:glycosyltransferase family 4 protein [Thermaerobacter sp.]